MEWGLLGRERLGSTRRVRTLGLAATIRAFNDLAVPGLGGVWYGKQIVLALLGIRLAEEARRKGENRSNITTANAVEALAVWRAFKTHRRHPRLLGVRKFGRLDGKQDPPFKLAASRAFYVSQPMRIGTLDALAAFGFVEAPSRRFNAYRCSTRGHALLQAACPEAPRTLAGWVNGRNLPARHRAAMETLDPVRPLPKPAREILREAVVTDSGPDGQRRRSALNWVEALSNQPAGHTDWGRRPPEIADAHWADMRAGAAFQRVVTAAAGGREFGSVLAHVEASMHARRDRKLATAEAAKAVPRAVMNELRSQARAFLDVGHDPSPGRAASAFCEECANGDDAALLHRLVARDGRILRLGDGFILPGLAFRGQPVSFGADADDARDPDHVDGVDEDALEAPASGIPPLPDGISFRIRNLMHLARDLRGQVVPAQGV